MKTQEALAQRRSYYNISNELEVSEEQIIDAINEVTSLVPDAFNMKSQRVAVVLGEKHKELWDAVYDTFGGEVKMEKIDTFKNGAGTVLFFTDKSVVENLQEQFELYAQNFPIWAQQSNGMLQLAVWTALRELDLGASLQHYNPIIDENVSKLLDLPENYVLTAQMPFGAIVEEPEAKEKEEIADRVKVYC